MSDRVTLLMLRFVFRPVASVLNWPLKLLSLMSWLECRYLHADLEVMFDDVFNSEHIEIESKRQLWIDHWLRRACRLEQAAKSRRAADKQRPGL